MAGQYRDINIRLHRDAFTTPWGFRLQGGRDFKAPLTVQRVFVGSPADTELSRGDLITAIERQPTEWMNHKQAQDIIRATGGTLDLSVRRGQRVAGQAAVNQQGPSPYNAGAPQTFRSQGLNTFNPKPAPALGAFSPQKSAGNQTELGTDFGSLNRPAKKAPTESMLNRVQQSLNSAIWTGRAEEDDYNYQQKSIGDLRNTFSGPTQLSSNYRPPTNEMAVSYASPLNVTVSSEQVAPVTTGVPNYNYDDEEEEYVRQGVKDLKNKFSKTPIMGRAKKGRERPPPRKMQHYGDNEKPPQEDTTQRSRPQSKWQKPSAGYGDAPPGLTEPGWSPRNNDMGWSPSPNRAPAAPRGGYVPTQPVPQQSYLETQSRPKPAPINRPGGGHIPGQQRPVSNDIPHFDAGPPAWAGSLRGSGGPKPWEVHAAIPNDGSGAPAPAQAPAPAPQASPRQQASVPSQDGGSSAFTPHQPRVQHMHYTPGSQTYSQHDQGNYNKDSDTAQVAHLQYNSPMQLYSKENAQQVLQAQTGGGPGQGTMGVTGGGGGNPGWDISKSETYRLIHESERGGPRSARYVDHAPGQEMRYAGYQDLNKQSPSMQALNAMVLPDGGVPAHAPQQARAPAAPAQAVQAPPQQQQQQQAPMAGGDDNTGYSDF